MNNLAIIDDNGDEISLEHHLVSLVIRKKSNFEQIKKMRELMSEVGNTALDLAEKEFLYEKNGAIYMKDSKESPQGEDAVLYKSYNHSGFGKPKKGEKRYQQNE